MFTKAMQQKVLVLLLSASLLVACGGAATPEATLPAEPAETEAPVSEEETPAGEEAGAAMADSIRLSSVPGAMHDTLVALAEKYMAANPDVEVTVEDEPEGGVFQALIAAGNQPDLVITSFGPGLGQLAAEDALIPLEELPGAAELLAQVEPGAVEQFSGHNYYIPIGADVTLMIYNKQLFEEAGLDPEDPPQTWDEFLAAAEAIDALPPRENGDEVYGTVFWNEALAWGGWYWNMLQPVYLNANQGECQLVNRLGSDIVFDQPECGMADFFEFVQAAQQYAPPTMEKNFFSRTIGMWVQYGYSWEPNLETAAEEPMVIGEDVGVAPAPVPNEGDTSFTTYGGRALVIMKTTPERQARAWDVLQFLMEEENNKQFITELGYLPVLTSLKDDPYFQEPARQTFVELLEHGVLPQQTSAADLVANALQGVYQEAVVEGELTPEEAVEAAAAAAREALAENQ
ncbi:MAG: extracellular solute-binding protein [Chloroflexi bacterium]|nr:extracellular solute-binding protein [Chloroflexota bacterium]MCI0648443.1 extracellular solute-binding protein [Chloroflexota bacterium]MCI0727589.1 extracellular solute-binding protein [Chloroflexota bacterium]